MSQMWWNLSQWTFIFYHCDHCNLHPFVNEYWVNIYWGYDPSKVRNGLMVKSSSVLYVCWKINKNKKMKCPFGQLLPLKPKMWFTPYVCSAPALGSFCNKLGIIRSPHFNPKTSRMTPKPLAENDGTRRMAAAAAVGIKIVPRRHAPLSLSLDLMSLEPASDLASRPTPIVSQVSCSQQRRLFKIWR